jgi:protoporphyrinogen oxidase
MILIAGAGLAGLSAAYHLKEKDYIVVEKEADIGGLCRTRKIGDFHFDYTGHLLHTRDPYFSRFLDENFPDLFEMHVRKSYIYKEGRYVPYPFQINTFGLSKDTIFDCVYEFMKARMAEGKEREKSMGGREDTFKDWILKNFGDGFARHFFLPFNEKLYCRDLSEISPEWTSWSIPVPSLEDVLHGAIGIRKTKVGYNQTFLYPRRGGIEVLPRTIASRCRNILLEKEIVSIDLPRKEALLKDGKIIPYQFFISTLPLNKLLSISKGLPEEMDLYSQNLKRVKVVDLNIAFQGSFRDDIHWIYFPEKEFPFYRAGISSNFSQGMAPEGYTSLYTEIALDGGETVDEEKLKEKAIAALMQVGIIKKKEDIAVIDLILIDPAYVVFDLFRKRHLEKIQSFFEEQGVFLAGRYGRWDYLPMEGAFLDGVRVAQRILELKTFA